MVQIKKKGSIPSSCEPISVSRLTSYSLQKKQRNGLFQYQAKRGTVVFLKEQTGERSVSIENKSRNSLFQFTERNEERSILKKQHTNERLISAKNNPRNGRFQYKTNRGTAACFPKTSSPGTAAATASCSSRCFANTSHQRTQETIAAITHQRGSLSRAAVSCYSSQQRLMLQEFNFFWRDFA